MNSQLIAALIGAAGALAVATVTQIFVAITTSRREERAAERAQSQAAAQHEFERRQSRHVERRAAIAAFVDLALTSIERVEIFIDDPKWGGSAPGETYDWDRHNELKRSAALLRIDASAELETEALAVHNAISRAYMGDLDTDDARVALTTFTAKAQDFLDGPPSLS